MKAATKIVIGMRNVGDKESSQSPPIFEGSLNDSLTELIKWLAQTSMATRFEIVLARTKDEVERVLIHGEGIGKKPSQVKTSGLNELMANLSDMLAGGEVGGS